MVLRVFWRVSVVAALAAVLMVGVAEAQQREVEVETVETEQVNDDQVKVRVVIRATHETGVPIVSNIPYVSRLFKNIGIGRIERTFTIPLHTDNPNVVRGVVCALAPPNDDCPQEANVTETATLPAPYYFNDDVQFFPTGPEFRLSPEAVAMATFRAEEPAQCEQCPGCPKTRATQATVATPACPSSATSAPLVTTNQAIPKDWEVCESPQGPCESPELVQVEETTCPFKNCTQCPVIQKFTGQWQHPRVHQWIARPAGVPQPAPHWQHHPHQQELAEMRAELQAAAVRQELYEDYFEAREEWLEERDEWIGEMVEAQVHAARLEAALEAAEAREAMFGEFMEVYAENARLQARMEVMTEVQGSTQAVTSPVESYADPICPPTSAVQYPYAPPANCLPTPVAPAANTFTFVPTTSANLPSECGCSQCECGDKENQELKQRIAELEKKIAELTVASQSGDVIR